MKSLQRVNGAVIGYGGAFNMGRSHLKHMEQAGINPVAACDLDPSRVSAALSDFPEIQTYTSVAALLENPGIDLVTIITPHNTHAALAIQVLEAGKSVICEKPMCITSQEATDMITAAEKRDVMLSVYHNRRHDGDFLALKDAIVTKQLIGDVFSIQAGFAGYGHPGHWWRSQKEISGGLFYDWGAHFIDWILNLMPGRRAVSVSAHFHKSVWHDVTTEDHVQAIIRFDNGAHADVSFSQIASVPMPRWRILGTKGGILDDGSVKDGFKLYLPQGDLRLNADIKSQETKWDKYYENIYSHLVLGEPLDVTPQSARRVISIIETAEKSAKSGKEELVPYE